MNSLSNTNTTNQQPELVLKLCNYFARNDPARSASLCKIAFTLLAGSFTEELVSNDEQFIVARISEVLNAKSKEDVEKFELLYANLCKSNVLQNRCAVLHFLLKMSNVGRCERKMSSFEGLEKFPLSCTILQPQTSLARSSNSQESIRSLYHGPGQTRSVQSSVTNLHSARSITATSSIWSRNDLEISPRTSGDMNLITERDILQDVIFSLQGIEGQFLRKEAGGDVGFVIDSKYAKNFTPIQRSIVERLVGTSFLHHQLKHYCDSNDKQEGIICQALIVALREELANYYKTVAILQTASYNTGMTLRKSLVFLHDHHMRFEWLAYIVEQCSDKKGGALLTSVHGFLQHGSNCAQEVSDKVLAAVCKPLYIMLSRWLLDGEINDPCNEFFIEARHISAAERLWHDKYHVRRSMVPSFILMDQAKKILATGKCINFLRQICKDDGQLPGRDGLQKLFKTTSAAALFTPEQSLGFHSILDKVYRETSSRVLDLLKDKFKLFHHLQALRRYLLLGQGDFIRHLMELLVPELNKPAQNIYGHTLSAILESAIRVTNAQFEDEDTLNRLNVSFMGHSVGDTGWDIFSLVYIIDGPVETIFQPTMTIYQCLFGALWKAKRMEFVLANMRKQQITMTKMFRKIKELAPVMHIIHILTSEMIHFLYQTQYYFLFEVLECSWDEMLHKVNQAGSLDDVINAHSVFLTSVETGVLLDESSRKLFSHLRSIYNVILTLESYQDVLNVSTTKEYDAYTLLERKRDSESGYGLTSDEEFKAKQRVATFHQFLVGMKTKVKHFAQTYQKFVKEYLDLLSGSTNMNLQLLSVRLNFNDYYRVM